GALALLLIQGAVRLMAQNGTQQDPFEKALIFLAVCATLVSFAWLRDRIRSWLTHAVFHQGNMSGLPTRLRDAPAFSAEDEYLAWAASLVAGAARTGRFTVERADQGSFAGEFHTPALMSVLEGSKIPRNGTGRKPWLPFVS